MMNALEEYREGKRRMKVRKERVMGLSAVEGKLARMAESIDVLRADIARGRVQDNEFWRKRCEALEERIGRLEDAFAGSTMQKAELMEDDRTDRVEARLAGIAADVEKLKRVVATLLDALKEDSSFLMIGGRATG